MRSVGPSASYHVLVVGDEPTGLMYAALAARAGYRVGVLGQRARPNTYRRSGRLYPRRAERIYGFGSSPAVDRVFGELSMRLQMRHRPEMVEPALQAVLPDRRFDLPTDGDRRRREIGRELPEEGDALRAFEDWAARWARASDTLLRDGPLLAGSGMGGRARYRRAVEPLSPLLEEEPPSGASPEGDREGGELARAVVESILAHVSGVAGQPLPPLVRARLWTHLSHGLYRIPGGYDGLKDLFIRKIREQCSDYRAEAVVNRVLVRRGRAAEVQLADREERLGCELLVANLDPQRLLPLLPHDGRRDRLRSRLAERDTKAWRVTVNFAVDPEVVPEGLGAEAVWIGRPGESAIGPDHLWISRPGAGASDRDGEPSGEEILTVTAHVPAQGVLPGPGELEELADAVRLRLRRVVPWLDEHLRDVDLPALREDPNDGEWVVDPRELDPITTEPIPRSAGVAALPLETPYRNVLMAGDRLLSGLGFEGAAAGALHLLDETRRRLKVKVPRPEIG